ncbi:MAG: hypothetical protein Q6370_013370, partial [Candidatus Sigynarchaeota archaeon]
YEGDSGYYTFSLAGKVLDDEQVTIPSKVVSIFWYNESTHQDEFLANCTSNRLGEYNYQFPVDRLWTTEVLFTCTAPGDDIYQPGVGYESVPFNKILWGFPDVLLRGLRKQK